MTDVAFDGILMVSKFGGRFYLSPQNHSSFIIGYLLVRNLEVWIFYDGNHIPLYVVYILDSIGVKIIVFWKEKTFARLSNVEFCRNIDG